MKNPKVIIAVTKYMFSLIPNHEYEEGSIIFDHINIDSSRVLALNGTQDNIIVGKVINTPITPINFSVKYLESGLSSL